MNSQTSSRWVVDAALIGDGHGSSSARLARCCRQRNWPGVVREDGVTPATPFDFGSRRIDLNKASGVG